MRTQATEILKLVGYARTTPGANIALIGVTSERTRHNIWRVILNHFDGSWAKDGRIASVDTLYMGIKFTNGSQLQCYGLNQPDKLRSQRFTAVYMDGSASRVDHALMAQLVTLMVPPQDAPPPRPVFGL